MTTTTAPAVHTMSLRIDPRTYEVLRRLAFERRCPITTLIREGIDLLLAQELERLRHG